LFKKPFYGAFIFYMEHYHIPHGEQILAMEHLGKYGYVEKKKFDADMLVELKE